MGTKKLFSRQTEYELVNTGGNIGIICHHIKDENTSIRKQVSFHKYLVDVSAVCENSAPIL